MRAFLLLSTTAISVFASRKYGYIVTRIESMCSNYLSLTSEENHNLASTDVSKLTNRALPNAPNGYAPAKVDCPSPRPSVRSAANLSSSERDWLKLRHQETQHSMKDFFGHVKISDFDAVKYLDSHSDKPLSLPNVGIAVSGGGYRALMNGAGALKAFDSRTDNSTAAGQLGGLLRSATYLTGLSGRMVAWFNLHEQLHHSFFFAD